MGRQRRAVPLVALALAALGLFAAGPAGAADGVHRAGDRGAMKARLVEASPDLAKVDSGLLRARLAERVPGLPIVDGLVQLDITAHLEAGVIERLEAAGLIIDGAHPQWGRVSGRAPLGALAAIAAIPQVRVVHQEYGFTTNVGSVANQADVSMRADVARATFGVDGTGVTVGILSDSLNTTLGGSTSGSGCGRVVTGMDNQASGDLPSPMTLLDNGPGGTTDEGAAMAELIHDVAPGAALAFHSAGSSQTDFASGIDDLVACGADVIVDDVIFFAEPMFQDGVVAQAAQDAVDAGVAFFSSAGNQGSSGVDEVYADVDPGDNDFGEDFHDFGPDEFAEITVPAFGSVVLVLQWNEPFDGAPCSGGSPPEHGPDCGNPDNAGPGALNDYDLYLFDAPSPTATALASSENFQGCSIGAAPSGDPLEVVTYENFTSDPVTAYLAVNKFCSGAPPGSGDRFRIATYPGDAALEAAVFDKAQIYGHAAAAGAVAVAAMDFCEIDTGGAFSGSGGKFDVESFSSLGGDLPIYFDASGAPIPGGPELRAKPEITAPDGSDTSFFGGPHPPGCGEDNGIPSFYGTSAAAPHAAAVAALMLENSPGLTPAAITATLMDNAVDSETAGFDFLSGAGYIDALDALDAASPAFCNGIPATIVGSNAAETIIGTPGPDVIVAKGGDDYIDGKGGADVICGGDGDDEIRGGGGADALFGQDGDDLLRGGSGNDELVGNQGSDTVDYSGSPVPVNVNLGQKKATGRGNDTIRQVANIIGSDFADVLFGSATANVIRGGPGNDEIQGKRGDDQLFGEGGNDQIRGRKGDDLIDGGGGVDQASFIQAPSGITVDLNDPAPQATGGDGSDTLVSIENLRGSNAADVLKGDSGDNEILGGGGADDINGRAGDDDLVGNKGNDTANGGGGTDRCRAETKTNCEV